jgi:hypothetical protein
MQQTEQALFDNLVRAGEQQGRHVEAERFRGLQVDRQKEPFGLLYRQIPRLCALQLASIPRYSPAIASDPAS